MTRLPLHYHRKITKFICSQSPSFDPVISPSSILYLDTRITSSRLIVDFIRPGIICRVVIMIRVPSGLYIKHQSYHINTKDVCLCIYEKKSIFFVVCMYFCVNGLSVCLLCFIGTHVLKLMQKC